MILAGDVGGTKTSLALARLHDGSLRLEGLRSYPSQSYASLEAVLTAYRANEGGPIEGACFGVAGPVLGGEAQITNLPWRISEDALRRALGIERVHLINDLTALAHSIPVLGPGDVATLQEGTPDPTGAVGILAPGTGLGQGYLCWDGRRYRPGASEGGHADFAPADDLQVRLLQYLRGRLGGHVSWERVLSGPGLYNIYAFLRESGGEQPAWVAERLATGDPSAAISSLALADADPLCSQALGVFVSIMGAQAGNLALTLMATGGVYLGGGIPPRILQKLADGTFLRAFRDKGRLSAVVERIPVRVIVNPEAPLLGAASCALGL
ncbi:MAG: glucokinase [Anaerolineae bacterium]|nr:glucokinase [Anaerolineae bacterium]